MPIATCTRCGVGHEAPTRGKRRCPACIALGDHDQWLKYRSVVSRHKDLEEREEADLGPVVSYEDWQSLIQDECHYCGGACSGLDRLDSRLGYSISNVVGSCRRCNVAKHSDSLSDFLSHLQAMYLHLRARGYYS